MYEIQKTPNILVVGDFMIDHYLWGGCERISPEAPVQVVDIKNETMTLGGAGNVVLNLLALGAKVDVATVLGDDETSKKIIKILKKLKINTEFIEYESARKTSIKTRIMASHQQIIRFDKESKENIPQDAEDKLKTKIFNNIKKYDAVLLSDYAKGVLTKSLTKAIIKEANKNNIFVLVDPKGADYSKYFGATLLTPNKKEASVASNIDIKNEDTLLEAIKKLKKDINLKYSIITLSEDGVAIYDEKFTKIPTIAREVYDVTGAGDTVLAAIGVGLSLGYDIFKSIHFATSAAAVVVAKLGSATASIEEIIQYEKRINQDKFEEKIVTCNELKNLLSKTPKKLVFTNGCFDILHVGHIKYLQKAKELGDILIVGLNSDSSVKKLKGENRPINNEKDRAILLSALAFVDFVVIFDEETPYNLIKNLKPNILVKGADYQKKDVIGSDLVDEVVLIEYIAGKSTTETINRIKQ